MGYEDRRIGVIAQEANAEWFAEVLKDRSTAYNEMGGTLEEHLAYYQDVNVLTVIVDDEVIFGNEEAEEVLATWAKTHGSPRVRIILFVGTDRDVDDPYLYRLVSDSDVHDVLVARECGDAGARLLELLDDPMAPMEYGRWKTNDPSLWENRKAGLLASILGGGKKKPKKGNGKKAPKKEKHKKKLKRKEKADVSEAPREETEPEVPTDSGRIEAVMPPRPYWAVGNEVKADVDPEVVPVEEPARAEPEPREGQVTETPEKGPEAQTDTDGDGWSPFQQKRDMGTVIGGGASTQGVAEPGSLYGIAQVEVESEAEDALEGPTGRHGRMAEAVSTKEETVEDVQPAQKAGEQVTREMPTVENGANEGVPITLTPEQLGKVISQAVGMTLKEMRTRDGGAHEAVVAEAELPEEPKAGEPAGADPEVQAGEASEDGAVEDTDGAADCDESADGGKGSPEAAASGDHGGVPMGETASAEATDGPKANKGRHEAKRDPEPQHGPSGYPQEDKASEKEGETMAQGMTEITNEGKVIDDDHITLSFPKADAASVFEALSRHRAEKGYDITLPTAESVISVAGIRPGIGCTHVACALGTVIASKGVAVAVALRSRLQLEHMLSILPSASMTNTVGVRWMGCDFYYWEDERRFHREYEVVVADCGVLNPLDRNRNSPTNLFTNHSKAKVMVASGAPWDIVELSNTLNAFDKTETRTWRFAANMMDDATRQDLDEMFKASFGESFKPIWRMEFSPKLFAGKPLDYRKYAEVADAVLPKRVRYGKDRQDGKELEAQGKGDAANTNEGATEKPGRRRRNGGGKGTRGSHAKQEAPATTPASEGAEAAKEVEDGAVRE